MSDREYFTEMSTALNNIYGSRLMDFNFNMHRNVSPIYSQGSPVFMQAGPEVIELNIVFAISVVELLTQQQPRGAGYLLESFRIGRHSPQSISQEQDYKSANRIVRLRYMIDDLDDFMDALNKESEKAFEKVISKQIDEKIND